MYEGEEDGLNLLPPPRERMANIQQMQIAAMWFGLKLEDAPRCNSKAKVLFSWKPPAGLLKRAMHSFLVMRKHFLSCTQAKQYIEVTERL